MRVVAPVFGKFMDLLRIRETVALTTVDLSAANPTIDLNGAMLAELGEYRVFQAGAVVVGADTVAVDPRVAANWDAIHFRGQETVIPVPADHDYVIYSMGLRMELATTVFYIRNLIGTAVLTSEILGMWDTVTAADLAFHSDGPQTMNYQSSMFSPVGDPSSCILDIGGSATVALQLRVLSAPPGLIFPHR